MRKKFLTLILGSLLLTATPVRADIWGGDVIVLTKILIQSIQQLYQLKLIFQNGSDTLGLLRDINKGIRDGLNIIQIINPKFNPGIFGKLENVESVLNAIEELYGIIPMTGEYRLQAAQDRSVSESIAMNGKIFRFADDVDEESRRIINHARLVNPQGAAKLTAQSVAVLIGVTTQMLRTNSMMLKMMAESMALENRKEKLQSAQFKTQYEGLTNALGRLPKETNLVPLEGQ
ncbi:MAG: hypothetical protein QE271_07970 [Bacteriovoracaceae bacterium]|nr:hypothetical protein [Bacteriovoracaceae bacterium]